MKKTSNTKNKKKGLPPLKLKKGENSNTRAEKQQTKSAKAGIENSKNNENKEEEKLSVTPTSLANSETSAKSDEANKSEQQTDTESSKKEMTIKVEQKIVDKDASYQLDKRQRFEIYKRRLLIKPPAKNPQEAIDLLNKTIDEIEDKYAPKKDDKFYALNSKRYGRMYPIPKDRIKFNPVTNRTELLAVGLIVYVDNDGSIEMWTVSRGNSRTKKLFYKNGCV